MDRETKENPILEPEQENPEKAGKKQSFPGLRRALKKAYQRFEAARARFVAGRNAFCRTLRSAFDSVAAFFLKIWAVIGPPCKKVAHAVAVAAKAVWKVLGPLLKKLWQWMKPGLLFLGNKIKAGAAYLAARFKALNKPMQIGIGAVSGSLVLLIIALMISSHVSRTALLAAEATPSGDSTLPVVSETQGPTLPPASPTPIPEPLQDKVLKKGDDSPTVAIVQTRLMELGYMDSDEPTEHFGSITEAALMRFQRHNDLNADGHDDVESVQTRLYELGYLGKNFITGTYGEKTSAAVADFQKANGIAPDGMVGHETSEVLYSDNVVGNFFSKGEVSDTIAVYQERLKKLGYLVSDYKVKGKMDDATITAIRKFQDNNDLTPDGCLGPTTMSAMDAKTAKAFTLKLGMKGSEVKAVQKHRGRQDPGEAEQLLRQEGQGHPQAHRQGHGQAQGHLQSHLQDRRRQQAHQQAGLQRHRQAREHQRPGRGQADLHRRKQDRLPLLPGRQGAQQIRLLRLRILVHEAGGLQRRLHDQHHLAVLHPLPPDQQHEPDPAGRHPGVQGQLHGFGPRGHLPGRRQDDRRQLRRGPGAHHHLRPLRQLLEAALPDGLPDL